LTTKFDSSNALLDADFFSLLTHSLVSRTPMIVEASPWEDSATLVAFGGENQLTILRRTSSLGATVRSGGIIESLRFSHVSNFVMSGRVSCLAWSPQSRSDEANTQISLAAACSDHSVQCHFATEHSTLRQPLLGHSDYINSICFVPSHGQSSANGSQVTPLTNGVHLASASDDHTVHLWNTEQAEPVQVLAMPSAAMSVKFHSQEPNLLMAAAASGEVSIFDLRGSSLIAFSLYSEHPTLLDADWSSVDPTLFGCVVNRRWLIWDVRGGSGGSIASNPSITNQIPVAMEGPACPTPLSKFRWSHTHANLFATLQAPSIVTVWDSSNPSAPISNAHGSYRFGGVTWLQDRACLLSGSHRQIFFTLM
jgi:WD40 repeat protein